MPETASFVVGCLYRGDYKCKTHTCLARKLTLTPTLMSPDRQVGRAARGQQGQFLPSLSRFEDLHLTRCGTVHTHAVPGQARVDSACSCGGFSEGRGGGNNCAVIRKEKKKPLQFTWFRRGVSFCAPGPNLGACIESKTSFQADRRRRPLAVLVRPPFHLISARFGSGNQAAPRSAHWFLP
jgi:hypothetical protein